jgi:hypothetical protein
LNGPLALPASSGPASNPLPVTGAVLLPAACSVLAPLLAALADLCLFFRTQRLESRPALFAHAGLLVWTE